MRRETPGGLAAAYVGALLVPVELLALVALTWLMPPTEERAWNTGQAAAHLLMVGAGLVVLALNTWWFVRAHLPGWGHRTRSEGRGDQLPTGVRRTGITLAISAYVVLALVITLVWLVLAYVVWPTGSDGEGLRMVSGFDLGAKR